MKCANCKYNDGMVYTSIPPQYRCTITHEFHRGYDDCNVEFAPVKHGRWIKLYHGNYKCSECGDWWGSDYNDEVINDFNYCPHCGTKMDLDEVEE